MFISNEFDLANADRKKRIEDTALRTAEKLNKRMMLFLSDVYKNTSIKESKKMEIRAKLLEHL